MKENLVIIVVILALFLGTILLKAKFKANPKFNLAVSLIGIMVFTGIFIAKTLKEGGLRDSIGYYLLLLAVVSYLAIKAYGSYKELNAK